MLYHEKRVRKAGYSIVAGIDEAGRGPLAGPVVAACVILNEYSFSNRVDDSKVLSARARDRAYREIINKSIYSVGIVNETVIDKVNIYQATARAMEMAVRKLKKTPDILLVDGRIKLKLPQKKIFITKGDSISLSIACASIVAKVTRDRIMERYHDTYPEYGFRKHKGYGTRQHKAALIDHGPSPIHRYSFKPVRASKRDMQNKKEKDTAGL